MVYPSPVTSFLMPRRFALILTEVSVRPRAFAIFFSPKRRTLLRRYETSASDQGGSLTRAMPRSFAHLRTCQRGMEVSGVLSCSASQVIVAV